MSVQSNWLLHVAKQALTAKADYACVVGDPEVRRGPAPLVLLDEGVAGWTLYTFRQPLAAVVLRAEEVGIAALYHVLTRNDETRLTGFGWLPATEAACSIKPVYLPYVRRTVLADLSVSYKRRPHSQSNKHWLRTVATKAAAHRSNYVLTVRDGELLEEGVDLRSVLDRDAAGSTLYSFRELTPPELGRVEDAGILRVCAAISRHDAVKIGLWPAHLAQEVEQNARAEIAAGLVEKWNG
jgi:hypothetical protein